ncbi:vomeronasal type-1 receptor 4-like [Moschus berezovskii]|uniref:vomeronasal type-1 receptor 4-like n=1 Tax=Moschus berezovskii TaxID=68408 RepID=UPI002443DA0E|nr:vomeronasal type-1 receptor 4-like [Moschus berezovskii]
MSQISLNHSAVSSHCCHHVKWSLLNDTTDSSQLAIGITFLLQTVLGLWSNFSLLYRYLFLYLFFTQCRLRVPDLICKHLTIANILVILSKGVPQTITTLRFKYFDSDFACRLILYVERVGRSTAISTTCLLSVFQTVTINPMNSCWKTLKVKSPKYIAFSIAFCWIQCMLVVLIFPLYAIYVSRKRRSTNMTNTRDSGYCTAADLEKISGSLYAALIVFPEMSLSVLIFWASGSMILTLYRHSRRVQYIHKATVSPRPSAESRATQSILLLASTFMCFHTLSCIFNVTLALFHNPSGWLVNAASLISVCFPFISPFLLMSRDSIVSSLCFLYMKNSVSPNLIRKT